MEGIHLWWIGEKEASAPMIQHVRLHVSRALDRPVSLHGGSARPAGAWDPRRKQHSSTRILKWLTEMGPRDGKVLGITDVDLFIPILTFVFGEAQLGGAAAVVSTARLTDPAALADPRVVYERLVKEAVHELGHAFGLLHCAIPGCVMGRSPSLREVDLKYGRPCAECQTRLAKSGGRGEA